MSAPEKKNAGEMEKPKSRRGPKPRPKAEDGSSDAKRIAAAVLEVLAGARTPQEAATALGVSVPCYYSAETRALAGLVSACEPLGRARERSADVELATLKRDNERLKREAARSQALARAAQRTIGLPSPATKEAVKGKKRRAPRVRALKAARELQMAAPPEPSIANGADPS